MDKWIARLKKYLKHFVELGLLLLTVSVFAEILFGPNVAFFGSQVTQNLVNLLNSIGDAGVAALILIFAITFVFRKMMK
mgnify:FL=1|tara:strand:- start:158 stop:394 length:237 start_codon:yes stop_codon:yes gene_type:complete